MDNIIKSYRPSRSKISLKSEKTDKTSSTSSRIKKNIKNKAYLKKRNDLLVIYNELNVTPKILQPIETDGRNEYISFSQLEIRSNYEISVFGNLSASVLQSHMHTQSIAAASQVSKGSIVFKDDAFEGSEESEEDLIAANFEDDEIVYVPSKIMPTRINITLSETSVIYLLEINSTTEVKGSREGVLVEKDNEIYDYLTIGKGKNRKTTNAEIQTSMSLLKTRSTIAKRPSRCHGSAFASSWDMYDTYDEKKEVICEKNASDIFKEDITTESEEAQMEKLLQYSGFQLAVLIMERALANNVYNQQQKLFRGLITQDPFRPNIEFKYGLDLLWTFKSIHTEGHPIITMQWHPINNDILAVGYGKFYYYDNKPGTVFCWNIKNPSQPEREYYFPNSVTSLSFSQFEPNLLAVGLYDGTVAILDICKKNVEQLMITKPSATTSYEPIWNLEWFAPDDYNINDNHVISVCEDGTVSSYVATKSNDLIRIEMLKTYISESRVKGVYKPKQCAANEIPITKSATALILARHPVEQTVFFVGTGEGTVHKCSENYQNQHVDILMAHSGPVYGLQFSQYCSKLFLTCGADSCINIWADETKEPLATLSISFNPIDGAEWCPFNSTIIANICGNSIYIWDLQRKTYMPASEHINPNNCRNTVMKFSPSGKNLAVGDIEGNLNIYTLVDVPFPPFYQAQMLEQVIFKSIVTRVDLVNKIKESGLIYTRGKSFKIV